jgi:hypothetical protein
VLRTLACKAKGGSLREYTNRLPRVADPQQVVNVSRPRVFTGGTFIAHSVLW